MVITELYKCLGKFIKEIHSILSQGGRTALRNDLSKHVKSGKGNPFANEIIQLLNKWDDVMSKLQKVSFQLEKGEKASILAASKELAKSVTELQVFIAGAFVEIGSFVPGPVGIVCSVVLAIGCFATGNIAGGFLNLLGAIPFVKCAKFLPKAEFLKILSNSGLNKFKPVGFEQYMKPLTYRLPKFTYSNKLSHLFENTVQQAQRTTDNLLVGVGSVGKKTPSSIQGIGSSSRTWNNGFDGWEKARNDLLEIKTFEIGVKNL